MEFCRIAYLPITGSNDQYVSRNSETNKNSTGEPIDELNEKDNEAATGMRVFFQTLYLIRDWFGI